MKKALVLLLLIGLLWGSAGCVDLYYARDFTYREFVDDHVKTPVEPIRQYLDSFEDR